MAMAFWGGLGWSFLPCHQKELLLFICCLSLFFMLGNLFFNRQRLFSLG